MQGHDDALDLDRLRGREQRLHGRVGGAQFDAIAVGVEALDGRIVAEESNDDIAAFRGTFLVDDNDVAVEDARLDHAVAAHAQTVGFLPGEFARNRERFEFLRWGQRAFANFRVVPPATGAPQSPAIIPSKPP